jgi:prevent-host-death family protein
VEFHGPRVLSAADKKEMWPQFCDTVISVAAEAHAVGLRELRHHTSEVLARVRHGETIDVTEHGRLIARIVPVGERQPPPVLVRLAESGRATLAQRPGYRPRMRPGDGTDRLSEAVAELRDEERW